MTDPTPDLARPPGTALVTGANTGIGRIVALRLAAAGWRLLLAGRSAARTQATLDEIARLPGATRIYCGHEYTQSNGRFAATVDPDNPQLKARLHAVDALRAAGRFTLPTTIAEENETNPFLRATDAGIMKAMGLAGADADAVFAEMRMRKNRFAS